MGTADPRIDRWLAKDRPWRAELIALRDILLSEDVTEALKWRQPCYAAHDSNICLLAAMSESVALNFFKGVLLDDPDDQLEAPGANSRSARYLRFHGVDEIRDADAMIRNFIRQAVENERQGRTVDLPADDFDLPEELVAELAADSDLDEAWNRLTPGRRRGWVLHFSGAKKSETRTSRIEKARDRILAGEGLHDR